jgi:methanogenic corrinoid protein MtbC1
MYPVDESDPVHPHRLAILSAATEGDVGTAFHLVRGLMDDGMPFDEILFDVLAYVQSELGRRWIQGDYLIPEEHAATTAVETLVASLAGFFDLPEDGTPVTVACAEGESHALPGRMITAHLLFLGWRATFLGPGVPADELGTYLRDLQPEALLLTASIPANLRGARASIAAAHDAGVPVLAGGQAFGPDDRLARALGADGWTADARSIAAVLRSWSPDIAAAEGDAVAPSPDLDVLLRRRLHIVSEAVDRVAAAIDPQTSADLGRRNWEDITMLYDTLASALTVAEPRVLSDVAGWHAKRFEWSDRSPDLVGHLLEALRGAIGDDAPEASRFLDLAASAVG